MKKSWKIYWIDKKYKEPINDKTRELLGELQKKYNFQYTPFTDLDKGIEEIKKIKFETVFVIVSGRYYQDYYLALKKLRPELTCNPVCLIYTRPEFKETLVTTKKDKNILKETFDSIENKFYNWGGVSDQPVDIKKFLGKYLNIEELKDPADNYSARKDNLYTPFVFEPIKAYEDLIIPILNIKYLKKYIKINEGEESEFTKKLEDITKENYSEFSHFELQEKIKYWLNIYTKDQNFFKIMGNEFQDNNFSNYNIFQKALYHGLDEGFLKSEFSVPLYFGTLLNKTEYDYIVKAFSKKKKGLNSMLFYSKQILSFSKDKKQSLLFTESKDDNNNSVRVIFETNISGIKKYKDLLSYNADITNFSVHPEEKEVDFFSYSVFVVEDGGIQEETIDNKKYKIIKLNYLGKYITDKFYQNLADLNEIKVEQLLNNESSKFIKDIKESYQKNEGKNDKDMLGLIKNLLIGAKSFVNKTKESLKSKINIQSIIEIKLSNRGKYIDEEYLSRYKYMFDIYFDDILQINPSNEIRNNVPEKIKLKFKDIIIDCEGMFMDCINIKEISFINCDINAVTNMAYMFSNCPFLTNINFNNFNTSHVISMKEMFAECKSLERINLQNFNTSNVVDMSGMFFECEKLKTLDISNFNITNVVDMSAMFKQCIALRELKFNLTVTQKLKDVSYMFRGDKIAFKIWGFDHNQIEKHDGFF